MVKVNLEEYHLSDQTLTNIALEFFGQLLAIMGETGIYEFGFEGDKEGAISEGFTLDQHAAWCAQGFAAVINSPTWRKKIV